MIRPNSKSNGREKYNRRDFLKLAGAGAMGLAFANLATTRAAGAKRPNVVFIGIEDIAPYLGCYGHSVVKTPNIDKLASEGMVFSRAYCQSSVCNPSRAAIVTGLRPETTAVLGNYDDWLPAIPPGCRTIPEYFGSQGYQTIKAGKLEDDRSEFLAGRSGQQKKRWEKMWDKKIKEPPWKKYTLDGIRPKYSGPYPEDTTEYMIESMEWGPSGLSAWEQSDGARTIEACRVFYEKHNRPFLLSLAISAPHYTMRAPKEFHDMYPPETILLNQYPADDLADLPVKYPTFNTVDELRLSDEDKKGVISSYYACISYADACVGRVIQELKKSGRDKDTIVFLWGDHGMHLGEHGLWRKETLFEESCHIPLIIKAPRIAKPGSVSDGIVELIDLYPTMAELCGLAVPEYLEGTSMVPLMKDPNRPWKKAAFTLIRRRHWNRSMRTKRWRYTEWGGTKEIELYDHENDPREVTNLAYEPDYSQVRKELHNLMEVGWKGALPD